LSKNGKIKLNLKHYLLLFIGKEGFKGNIPSIRFWSLTLLIVNAGVEIEMFDGHILTAKDIFREIEDLFNEMGKK